MSERFWRPTGRAADAISLFQAFWGVAASWTVVATVMTWIASHIESIWSIGWAAAVFAGIAAALATALLFFLGCAGLAAYRYFKPVPVRADAADRNEKNTANEERFDNIERKLRGVESVVPVLERVSRDGRLIVERTQKEISAGLSGWQKAEAKFRRDLQNNTNATARIDTELKNMQDLLAQTAKGAADRVDGTRAGLLSAMSDISKRLTRLESRQNVFESLVFNLLRARDAEAELIRLDAQSTQIFTRLLLGEPNSEEAWVGEFTRWTRLVCEFWEIAAQWVGHTPKPLSFAESNMDHNIDVPDGPLFASDAARHRYRTMIIAESKHSEWKARAIDALSIKANPPP